VASDKAHAIGHFIACFIAESDSEAATGCYCWLLLLAAAIFYQ